MWEAIVEFFASLFEGGGGETIAAETATDSTFTIGGMTVGELAAKVAPTVASMVASYAISSIFAKSASIAHPDAQTYLGNGYSSLDPIVVLYGERRIGCNRARIAVRSSSGNTNDILIVVGIWGEGPVTAIDYVFFDDVLRVDQNARPFPGDWAAFMYVAHHLGADDQEADLPLCAQVADDSIWNPYCKLSGIAYTHLQLGWTADRFPTGQPNITAYVRGRTLYDPRTTGTSYLRNPALAIRDYLTNTRYGCRVPSSMIDDTAFQSAANTCDEPVTVPTYYLTGATLNSGGSGYRVNDVVRLGGGSPHILAEITVTGVSGGAITSFSISNVGLYAYTTPIFNQYSATQYADGDSWTSGSGLTLKDATWALTTLPRYSCDGVVNIDQQPIDNVRALLTCCRGFLVFSGGKYKLKIDKAETPVSFVLSEDNIVGGWSIQLGGKRNRFNRVKTRFFNADLGFNGDLAFSDSPTDRDTYDNGVLLETQLDLPFTTNVYRAEHIAQIERKRSRFNLQVQLVATIAATCLEVGDVVPVAHATPGWPAAGDPVSGKLFRVMEMELLANDEVRITLLEYSSTVYDLDEPEVVPPIETSLPDARTVAVPGTPSAVETLIQTSGSAGVRSKVTVTWGAAADVFVTRGGFYELEYKTSTSAAFKRQAQLSDTSIELFELAPDTVYNFRVRAVNSLGVHSSYSATTSLHVYGLTAPPSSVSNFAVQSYAGQAKFTWAKPTATLDLDVLIGGRTYVRWSPLTTGATWDHGSLVNPDGYPGDTSIGFGPLMTGTYMAKHRDSSGNYSTTEASFVVTEALITGLTTVATVTESPTFTGTKSNVAAVDGGIQLDSVTLIDSMLTLMDDWGSIDSLGGVQATGTYTFANVLDQGAVQSCRLYATIGSLAFDSDDLIDSRTNNIDDWGLFDGAVVEDAEVQLMVSTTDDNPSGTPSWSAYHALGFVGDYPNRAYRFRLDFASGNATHNRTVTSLSVSAKR